MLPSISLSITSPLPHYATTPLPTTPLPTTPLPTTPLPTTPFLTTPLLSFTRLLPTTPLLHHPPVTFNITIAIPLSELLSAQLGAFVWSHFPREVKPNLRHAHTLIVTLKHTHSSPNTTHTPPPIAHTQRPFWHLVSWFSRMPPAL